MEATTEHQVQQVPAGVTPVELSTGEVTSTATAEEQQLHHSLLVERLTSYYLINSLYQTYDSVKQASPLLKVFLS
jgi:hypothetical protein